MEKSRYKCIFLDVGNILFHDMAVDMVFSYFIYNRLDDIAQKYFFKEREKKLKDGNLNWIYDYCHENKLIESEKVAENAWGIVLKNWLEINVPVQGAISSLKKLSKNFSVNIAANQPIETIKLLEAYNIVKDVDSVILDSQIGVSKPNDLFYKHVLAITGNSANETLYVGDRFDNDVVASKRNGLTPVWIQYHPIPIRSNFVPDWWAKDFYNSYLTIGPYNIWKYSEQHNDLETSNIFSSLSSFAEKIGDYERKNYEEF